MKAISILNAVCLSLALHTVGVAQDSTTVEPDSTESSKEEVTVGSALDKEVENLLRSLVTLRKAGTRSMLSRDFQIEGGLSTPRQQTFVWKKCVYIKVDVKFDVSADEITSRLADAQDKDKILSISKPYLARPIFD